jgi:hypothetical protein
MTLTMLFYDYVCQERYRKNRPAFALLERFLGGAREVSYSMHGNE